jgi:hypothetical protein
MNNQSLAPRASYNGTAHRFSQVVNRLTSFTNEALQAAFSHWIADFVAANAVYWQILVWNTTYAATSLHLNSYHASSSVHNLNALNSQLIHWDTNNVTNVGHIFEGASCFNMPMNQTFDTQNVVNMHRMLNGAPEFNQHDRQHLPWNLDTRRVVEMGLVFNGGSNSDSNLNQPLGVADNITNVQSSLVTRNVTAMSNTFERATQFNQHPPFSFVTSNVVGMMFMSNGASNFNQPPTPGNYA